MSTYTFTIIHRRTREVLHTVTLPTSRDVRKDKADAIATWRTASFAYLTPVAVLVSN